MSAHSTGRVRAAAEFVDRLLDGGRVISALLVYAGTHQHLAAELHVHAESDAGLRMHTGAQRLYEWSAGIRFPMLCSGRGSVRVHHDRAHGRFEVDFALRNPVFGRLFDYHGWLRAELRPCRLDAIPAQARPVREERRD